MPSASLADLHGGLRICQATAPSHLATIEKVGPPDQAAGLTNADVEETLAEPAAHTKRNLAEDPVAPAGC